MDSFSGRRSIRCAVSFAAILILVIGASESAECRGQHPAFALQLAGSHNSIFPDFAVWKVGESVRVIVTMINRSNREVHYSLTNPGWDWRMDVRDAEGKPVGETELFRQMKESLKNGLIQTSRKHYRYSASRSKRSGHGGSGYVLRFVHAG
jgi:hypothetical protein